jgi:hypothetical protein
MRNPYKDVTVTVEYITPQKAKEWLEKNTNNFRKAQSRTYIAYRKAMLAGEFGLTHDAIGFDASGRLLNGQHRLIACVESGKGFWSLVARNMPGRSEVQTDTGSARTLPQILKRTGALDVACTQTAAGCRDACSMIGGRRNFTSTPRGDVPAYEVEEFCKNNRELINTWRGIAGAGKPGVLGMSRRKLLALALVAGRDGDSDGKLEDFLSKLTSGLNTGPFEPAAALRRKLEEHARRGVKMSDKMQWSALVAAWNKHKKGTETRTLRVPEEVQEILTA